MSKKVSIIVLCFMQSIHAREDEVSRIYELSKLNHRSNLTANEQEENHDILTPDDTFPFQQVDSVPVITEIPSPASSPISFTSTQGNASPNFGTVSIESPSPSINSLSAPSFLDFHMQSLALTELFRIGADGEFVHNSLEDQLARTAVEAHYL